MTLDPIYDIFLTESADLLQTMETELLALEKHPNDLESINSLFRAVHTLKGSGSILHLEETVKFTHTLESLLDELRNGKLTLTKDLTALLLESHDLIEALIRLDIYKEPLSGNAREAILSILRKIEQQYGEPQKGNPAPEATQSSTISGGVAKWHISLRFDLQLFKAGFDPYSFIRFLGTKSKILNLIPVCDQLPDLNTFDPEKLYLGFEIDVESDKTEAELRDVFDFIADTSLVLIIPYTASADEITAWSKALPESADRMKALLAGQGFPPTLASVTASVEQNPKHAEPDDTADKVVTHKDDHSKKTLRIDAGKLDTLMNLVGELVTTGAAVRQISESDQDSRLTEVVSSMTRLIESLRDNIMSVRMVQIGETFRRFERIIRDHSVESGKKIEFSMSGTETELDKSLIENLYDPLVHLVRNAIDHGIESAQERLALGKPESALLSLRAWHDTGSIVVEISDDGRGLDREKILQKAIKNGLFSDSANVTDEQIYDCIFKPGFSTAEKVTSISGRGVGMDVVRRNIEQMKGTVELKTKRGHGTTFTIRLPLTLAIIDGFSVRCGLETYIIPLETVMECFAFTAENGTETSDLGFIDLRGEILSCIELARLFGSDTSQNVEKNVIVVQTGALRAGLIVNELHGHMQAVIKPLGKYFEKVKVFSGATILGNGDVAMVLDVGRLAEIAAKENSHNKTVVEKVN